jgi:hypothetical protein
MSEIMIVDNEYITMGYRPDGKMIYHTIHKPIGTAQTQLLMDALDAGTATLRQHKVLKWLSDDRLNGPLSPEFLTWSLGDWCPRTIDAGWKYWANIVPKELAAAGTLVPVMENLHKLGLRMRVFTNVEEGLEWLAEM